MKLRRTPFYGEAVDVSILPEAERERFVSSSGDGSEPDEGFTTPECTDWAPPVHPDATEKGIELPLGFHAHQGENRKQRLAGAANWTPPKVEEGEKPPTRRALLKQRQKHRRGKLDPELRRLQKKKAK